MTQSKRPDDATLLAGDPAAIAAMYGVHRDTVIDWRCKARRRAGISVHDERVKQARHIIAAYNEYGHNLTAMSRALGMSYSGAHHALNRARKLLNEELEDGRHWEPELLSDPADLTPVRYDDVDNPDIDRRAQLSTAVLDGWRWVSQPRHAMRSAA